MEKLLSLKNLNIDVGDEENASELLEAQAHIWNHIFSFINSMSLKCAIQMGIPDTIHSHGKPMTLSQLTAVLPINQNKAPCIHRLMRILIHSGFFALRKTGDEELEEGYVLTAASKLLLKDNPLSVAPFLLAMLDPVLTKPWDLLSAWFQTHDATPFKTVNGMSLWEYGSEEAKVAMLFNEGMASDARLVTSIVMEKCGGVFEGMESVVDVGGGTGTVAKAIAAVFPQMECTVFDLPHVVAGLSGSENLKFVGGDMFDAVPPGDAILLKWILHDWNDEDSVKILKKCKEALSSKGKIIIIDMIVENQDAGDDKKSYETQLFFDMLMMVLVSGRERNEKEWAKLFQHAGFTNYKITPILGLRSLIEVYP